MPEKDWRKPLKPQNNWYPAVTWTSATKSHTICHSQPRKGSGRFTQPGQGLLS